LSLTGPHHCDLPRAYVSVVGLNKSCWAQRRTAWTKGSHLTFQPTCQNFNLALLKCKSKLLREKKKRPLAHLDALDPAYKEQNNYLG